MIAALDSDRWFNLQAWTLQQPYASGIALGAHPARRLDGRWKDVENRPQRRHLPPEGRWYGLHAGKVFAPWPESDPPWARLLSFVRPVSEPPCGVMLGAFHVSRCVHYPDPLLIRLLGADVHDPFRLRANPSAFGPWCYLIDRVVLLPEPMPCRGMNGTWPIARIAGKPVAEAVETAIAGWRS